MLSIPCIVTARVSVCRCHRVWGGVSKGSIPSQGVVIHRVLAILCCFHPAPHPKQCHGVPSVLTSDLGSGASRNSSPAGVRQDTVDDPISLKLGIPSVRLHIHTPHASSLPASLVYTWDLVRHSA